MQTIWMVITNNGDGSNGVKIVKDQSILDKMRDLVDEGDESYASGDGLQDRELQFPDGFDVDAWVKQNFWGYTTLEDME